MSDVARFRGFNTQPPEGGWISIAKEHYQIKRFNTQPPEGGWQLEYPVACISGGFNTQPPEGGWGREQDAVTLVQRFQHTAARRRLEPLSKALLHQVSQP